MGKPGIWELVIILVIVIIIFGVGKLPELGGALGKSIREFKSATKSTEDATKEVKEANKETDEGPKSEA